MLRFYGKTHVIYFRNCNCANWKGVGVSLELIKIVLKEMKTIIDFN